MRTHVNMNHCSTHLSPRMFIIFSVSTKIQYTIYIFVFVLRTQPISSLFISSPWWYFDRSTNCENHIMQVASEMYSLLWILVTKEKILVIVGDIIQVKLLSEKYVYVAVKHYGRGILSLRKLEFHLRTEAGSFRNEVFFWVVVMTGKALVNVADITHVKLLSKFICYN